MDTHYDIVRAETVGSTQDVASERFTEGGEPVLVLAERQVAGRGRQGRTWVEPDRAMYSSFAFEPGWPPTRLALLPLSVGVAVRRALRSLGETVELKWPNDLMRDDAKVGGILVEASEGVVVAGCGVNVSWVDPPAFAAAAFPEEPEPGIEHAMAVRWVDEFLSIVADGPDAWPIEEYRNACITVGADVSWDGGEGTALDISESGALVVETVEGLVTLTHGDVHLQRHG